MVRTIQHKTIKPLERQKAGRYNSDAWVKSSAAWLDAYPFCVLCMVRGKLNEGALNDDCARQRHLIVDHIEPHRGDINAYWNQTNWQTLCRFPCHDVDKQRHDAMNGKREQWIGTLIGLMREHKAEEFVRHHLQFIPASISSRLFPSTTAKRLVVYGPPCSGKTTAVRATADDAAIIWDFDDVAMRLVGSDSRRGIDPDQIHTVMIERERVLSQAIASDVPVYWICTTREDAQRTATMLSADVRCMDTSEQECITRLKREPMSPARVLREEAIRRWFSQNGTNIHYQGSVSPHRVGGVDAREL